MSLFKKKKKEDIKFEKTLPSLEPKSGGSGLKIPSLPEGKTGFPSYDKEFSSIKQEVDKASPIPKLEIPQRKPVKSGLQKPPKVSPPSISPSAGKPIFVKVDNYQDALAHMNNLRELIKQGESILSELTSIREEEDRHLSKWYHDIERIKEKLLSMDKKLFES